MLNIKILHIKIHIYSFIKILKILHMKNFTVIILLLANFSLFAQNTYVPDDNFEQALIDLGYDSGDLDNYVLTANISGVTTLNVSSESISDLTGIEDFTALKKLYCYKNDLTSLDVSANTALTQLLCYSNKLTSLDISVNTALKYLYCYSNELTSLDASANTALKYLYCYSNELTSLDVSGNTVLTKLFCYSNELTSLDVSTNTSLTNLRCYNNQLTSLDVSANTDLELLYCYLNDLTSLDLRNSNNANLTYFNATSNPDLTCIYVDDNTVSYSYWDKDETATYVNDEDECTALATTALESVSEEKSTTYMNDKVESASIAIDGLENVSEFSLFPNPVKEQFTIQTNKKVESLKLYNLAGKLVKEFDVQDTYSVSGLSAGVYFLNVSCEKETFNQKLIIE